MSHDDRALRPVYRIGDQAASMLDLLRRFTDPEYQAHGVSRLSDLHLKVGEPARYRFDDDLVPVPRAERLTEETLRELLFPLLILC